MDYLRTLERLTTRKGRQAAKSGEALNAAVEDWQANLFALEMVEASDPLDAADAVIKAFRGATDSLMQASAINAAALAVFAASRADYVEAVIHSDHARRDR